MGYPLLEGRVPVCGVGGEGERSDGMPGGRTPPQEPKKKVQRSSRKRRGLEDPMAHGTQPHRSWTVGIRR